jgi:uracil DNA glycosylase
MLVTVLKEITQIILPSPMSSASFVGCGHFERANKYLKKPIDWCSICDSKTSDLPKAKRPRF